MSTTMENAPGTCGMIFPRHPDDERRPNRDDPCLRPAIGTTEDGGRVCRECAADMESEGFRVDRDPPVPVTGETISDEQIRELLDEQTRKPAHERDAYLIRAFKRGLERGRVEPSETAWALNVCAAAWNARRGATP